MDDRQRQAGIWLRRLSSWLRRATDAFARAPALCVLWVRSVVRAARGAGRRACRAPFLLFGGLPDVRGSDGSRRPAVESGGGGAAPLSSGNWTAQPCTAWRCRRSLCACHPPFRRAMGCIDLLRDPSDIVRASMDGASREVSPSSIPVSGPPMRCNTMAERVGSFCSERASAPPLCALQYATTFQPLASSPGNCIAHSPPLLQSAEHSSNTCAASFCKSLYSSKRELLKCD